MTYAPLLYPDAATWSAAWKKHILLFGMSGLGKTFLSMMLRGAGNWFHYSIDYRIGTRYMGERIADDFKREAMKVPALRKLLMTDSIYIASNITFENLTPVSTYLGKPGNPAEGGLPIDTYRQRQEEFRLSEIAALEDTSHFIRRAREIYGYDNFVCDSGGSICEWVNPEDRADPLLQRLASETLMIWLEGTEDHRAELIRRFERDPKPMCYRPSFLSESWEGYLAETGLTEGKVAPDDFLRWTYARALDHRQPLYAAMAQNWGISLPADKVSRVRTEEDFLTLVGEALEARAARA